VNPRPFSADELATYGIVDDRPTFSEHVASTRAERQPGEDPLEPEYMPAAAVVEQRAPKSDGLQVVCVADVQSEPVSWAWRGRIPLGSSTLLVGNPGDGKSMTTIDIAARVSTGAEWPDASGRAPLGEVILLAGEDDIETTIRPRLEAAGADLTKIHCIRGVTEIDPKTGNIITRSVRLDQDIHRIEALFQKQPDVKLLIVDPISEYLGRTDSHKNAEVRGVLSPFSALAAKYGVALLLVTHMSKGSAGGPALYRAMGSLAFTAMARVAWCHVRDADDPDRVLWLPLKNNLHKKVPGLAYKIIEPGRIEWQDGDIETTADEAMQNAAGGKKTGDAISKALAWLKQRLADGKEVESDALADEAVAAGISKGTHIRSKQDAKDEGWLKNRKGKKREQFKWFVSVPTAPDAHVAIDAHLALVAHDPFDQEAQQAQEEQHTQEEQEAHVCKGKSPVRHDDPECASREWWLASTGKRYCRVCKRPLSPDLVIDEGTEQEGNA
jgi:hypothetical protein